MEHPSVRLANGRPNETKDERLARLLTWDLYCRTDRELNALSRARPLSNQGQREFLRLQTLLQRIEQGEPVLDELDFSV